MGRTNWSSIAEPECKALLAIFQAPMKSLHSFQGHTEEAFVLEPHPIHANLLLSAGHDGNLIIWNLHTGDIVKKHHNRVSGL